MDRSNRALLFRGILSALILIGVGVNSVSGVTCNYKTVDKYCALLNISIRTDTEAGHFVFPNETSLFFIQPNFSRSGSVLFSHVPKTVKTLIVNGGSVPEITIKSTLADVRVYGNHLREVIIDETGLYLTTYFGVWQNQLRSVPENVTKLTNLVKLYLHENEIESVNMDHFKGLAHLQVLSLFANRITRIDTTMPLSLPNLAELYLYENYLSDLTIRLWNFPNLKSIRVDNNKLRTVEGFPDRFPKLNSIVLNYNRWNCSWLSKAHLWTGKIVVYKGDEICSESNIRGFCCEDARKNFLVKTVANQLEQTSSKLQSAVAQIGEKISSVASKIQTIAAREMQNLVFFDNDRRQMEEKVDEYERDINRIVQAIKEEAKSEDSRMNAKMVEIRTQIHDMKSDTNHQMQKMKEQVKSMQSATSKELLDKLEKTNTKMNENQALVGKNVDDLKNDLLKQLDKTNNQIKRKLKKVQQMLSENRAMILTNLWKPLNH